MPISMYKASVPNFIHSLTSLLNILDKASDFAESKKIDGGILVNSRLAADMFPLARQVQIATDAVKGCAARLAGVEVPSFPDTEATLPELKTRVQKTIDFLKTLKAEQIDGSEEKEISLKVGPNQMSFKGQEYLLSFAIPNLYFHVTATYAILRHNGVDLGKMDFLGKIQ